MHSLPGRGGATDHNHERDHREPGAHELPHFRLWVKGPEHSRPARRDELQLPNSHRLLSSDDGALVYIDGSLLIDRGGPHGPSTSDGTLFLSAGPHSLEVQFFECCGGRSGVDFSIPLGVTATTPLPAALPLMGSVLGGGFLVSLFRRRREKKAA